MQVEVVAEVDGWLHCVACNGAKGLVPSSYVRLLGAGNMAGLQQQPSSAVSMHASALHARISMHVCRHARVSSHMLPAVQAVVSPRPPRGSINHRAALRVTVLIPPCLLLDMAWHTMQAYAADHSRLICTQQHGGDAGLSKVKATP